MTDDAKLMMDRRQILLTTASAATLLMLSPTASTASKTTSGWKIGRSQSFDLGWRFHRGAGQGIESPAFDDSGWRAIDVPHDWSIEDLPPQPGEAKPRTIGPFDPKAVGGTAIGFTVGGEGWYRKRFRLDRPARGRVEIHFEGIYMDSDVWLNGRHLGTHPFGYTPVGYDLTPHLSDNGENVLAVRVRNLGENSRWYAGSGVYRHVWLDVLPEQARIARWGVGIRTRRIMDARADLEISTRLEDLSDGLTLLSRVKDERGRILKEFSTPASANVDQALTLESPRLWSPDKPTLYTLQTELRRGEVIIDRTENSFGIRVVRFDPQRGMTINGVSTKLRGGCIHHDNGLLGAAAFDAAEERKVLLLKARGFNAVRPSHNPFSRAFLNACDQHGLFVIAEAFDTWNEPKLPEDYSKDFDAHWRDDLSKIVLSARNHPSIIMWSIGNEVPGRNSARGVELQWNLTNEVHRLDPTRPVTAAINGFAGRSVTPSEKTARAGFAGVPDQTSTLFLDVVGYNYKLDDYEADHERFPERILFGSESFPKDVVAIWDLTEKTPWLIGDFVWTAMDYLGEAGIGGSVAVAARDRANPMALMSTWPHVNAFCGDLDLIGQPKPQSHARDVVWGLSPLEVVVLRPMSEGKLDVPRIWGWPDELSSWTWPGAEGRLVTVRVHTVGDRVELRLNGRVLESKPVTAADAKRVEFETTYQPGVLEVLALRNGAEIARKRLATVGAPAAIRLTPEHAQGGASRGDVSYVSVEIVDAEARVVPDAAKDIRIAIVGAAELVAFGSANPLAIGSFQAPTAQTWNGRAVAIVRGKGSAGRVKLIASGEGLRSGSTLLQLT